MSTMTAVAQFIVDEFAPDVDPGRLDRDYDLLDGGIVDSLGLLTIVAWIEDRFGLPIDVGEIGPDDLCSVRAMATLIDGLRTATHDGAEDPRLGTAPG